MQHTRLDKCEGVPKLQQALRTAFQFPLGSNTSVLVIDIGIVVFRPQVK